MDTNSQWQALKAELRKEARSRFYSMGEIVLIEPNKESDLELTLSRNLEDYVCAPAECCAMGDG